MFFDAHAALAKLKSEPAHSATIATTATQAPESKPCVASVADVATPQPLKFEKPDGSLTADGFSPYGQSLSDGQLTWTGKIVSLDDWRRLSDWDRHGSTGKMWNGQTKRWEPQP